MPTRDDLMSTGACMFLLALAWHLLFVCKCDWHVQAHMDPYDPSQRLQKRWKYMPHFLSKDLGKLWDLWELQNTHRTFYLGSITCFESTADVHSYNMQLADYYQL